MQQTETAAVELLAAQRRADRARAALSAAAHDRRVPLLTLHAAGWSSHRIAGLLGISHVAVLKALRTAGVR